MVEGELVAEVEVVIVSSGIAVVLPSMGVLVVVCLSAVVLSCNVDS